MKVRKPAWFVLIAFFQRETMVKLCEFQDSDKKMKSLDVVLEETMTMTVWPNFPTANMAYRKIPR